LSRNAANAKWEKEVSLVLNFSIGVLADMQ